MKRKGGTGGACAEKHPTAVTPHGWDLHFGCKPTLVKALCEWQVADEKAGPALVIRRVHCLGAIGREGKP